MSKELSATMIQYASVTDTQKVKVPSGEVRDLIARKKFYETSTVAAVTILSWMADNLPIAFEERKNIEELIRVVALEPDMDKIQMSQKINDLLAIANHYTK